MKGHIYAIMLKISSFKFQSFSILGIALALMLACETTGKGQTKTSEASTEKAEQVVKRALEAVGGTNYSNVQTVIGRGQFTQFRDGASGDPVSFVDYIVYPDKERTEFKIQGDKVIQTNTGETGWVFDGAAKTLKDMKPAQVEDFKLTLRTSVENLLRGAWRASGAKLSYAGRREAGVARRNETVRLTYPDGFIVEFEFDSKDYLPAKVRYTRKNAEGVDVTEEDHLLQNLGVQGITVPFVVDHFIGGVQTSRINYQSIEFNHTIADSIFARPANAKAVK